MVERWGWDEAKNLEFKSTWTYKGNALCIYLFMVCTFFHAILTVSSVPAEGNVEGELMTGGSQDRERVG